MLRDIYESYVVAASPFGLPMIIGTPTFRASPNFVRRAGLGDEAVRLPNADAVKMHQEIKIRSDHPVFVAGVIGPSGDAYKPEESLPAGEASEYHAIQAGALADAGVDFLCAPTFPATEEALGVERIDAEASPAPLFYSISCVHPSIAARALRDEEVFSDLVARRLVEFKANASALSAEELVKLDHPEGDDPERLAAGMWEIHEQFGLRILGGCCRTDDCHIRALAARMAGTAVRDRGLE